MGDLERTALVVFGTRPEAIKLSPVVAALEADGLYRVATCATGQHSEMVAPVCDFFSTPVHHDLAIMRPGQTLTYVAESVIAGVSRVIQQERPSVCIVQGDTTTALAAALAAFYCKVPVAHVEAGLRTGDLSAPWPEEGNRVLISRLAAWHFAPTTLAEQNLLKEGAPAHQVHLTGNTVVDAALRARQLIRGRRAARVRERFSGLDPELPVVLFTMHRRESFGAPMARVFQALRQFCRSHAVQVVFPTHPNPNVLRPAREILAGEPNIHLMDPLDYDEMVHLLSRCRFVITDSGGLVEEAPTFRKPVLVLRDTTERSEAVDAGSALLCGVNTMKLTALAEELLSDGRLFQAMSAADNPFGDGRASERIARRLADAAEPEPRREADVERLGRAI